MALKFEEIVALTDEMNEHVAPGMFVKCLCFGKDKIVMIIKNDLGLFPIAFCFHSPFARFHLTKNPESSFQNHFTTVINEHLNDAQLKNLTIENCDRIVFFNFIKDHRQYFFVMELFTKSTNGYLLNQNKEILISFFTTQKKIYDYPKTSIHYQMDRKSQTTSSEIEMDYLVKEADFAYQKEKLFAKKLIQKKIKVYQKKIAQDELQMAKSLLWKDEHHIGQLLQSNLYRIHQGDSEVVVDDWESGNVRTIALDPLKKVSTQVAEKFKRSHKLKAGIPHNERLSKQHRETLNWWKNKLLELEGISDHQSLVLFSSRCDIGTKKSVDRKQAEHPQVPGLPYRLFKSTSGFNIWVGKNARENEVMTFRLARGLDLWLHVSGTSGSHVIIRSQKDREIDEMTIQEACQLAMHYSKAKYLISAEIVMTHQKFVKRADRRKKGKVFLAHPKRRLVTRDPELLERIKDRGCRND